MWYGRILTHCLKTFQVDSFGQVKQLEEGKLALITGREIFSWVEALVDPKTSHVTILLYSLVYLAPRVAHFLGRIHGSM